MPGSPTDFKPAALDGFHVGADTTTWLSRTCGVPNDTCPTNASGCLSALARRAMLEQPPNARSPASATRQPPTPIEIRVNGFIRMKAQNVSGCRCSTSATPALPIRIARSPGANLEGQSQEPATDGARSLDRLLRLNSCVPRREPSRKPVLAHCFGRDDALGVLDRMNRMDRMYVGVLPARNHPVNPVHPVRSRR